MRVTMVKVCVRMRACVCTSFETVHAPFEGAYEHCRLYTLINCHLSNLSIYCRDFAVFVGLIAGTKLYCFFSTPLQNVRRACTVHKLCFWPHECYHGAMAL